MKYLNKAHNAYVYGIKGERERRYFLHTKKSSAKIEMVWKRHVSLGFKIHFGDKGSETPFDGMLSIGIFAIFFGARTPRLTRFCVWVGQGHKRNISLTFHAGSMWWELWYDDDMGYDNWHNCDKRRKPIWPWSMGREKYRSWMCLRNGNIAINPLDAFWGHRNYHYEDVAEAKGVRIIVNQFFGDDYLVDFTLQKQTRAREYGPEWARGRSENGYCASWESEFGIPTQNHSWKGDCMYASAEKTSGGDDWVGEVRRSLVERTLASRARSQYHIPKEVCVDYKHEGQHRTEGIRRCMEPSCVGFEAREPGGDKTARDYIQKA